MTELKATVELKPCPFCGSAACVRFAEVNIIRCSEDGCAADPMVNERSPEAAIAAWNTRAPDVVSRKLYEALKVAQENLADIGCMRAAQACEPALSAARGEAGA